MRTTTVKGGESMRRVWMAAVVALACACGAGGGGLPVNPNPTQNGDQTGDGTKDPSPDAVETSLSPLTTGSSWTYKITDPLRGVFDKHVSVMGPSEVPGESGVTAIRVDNSEPTLDEISWQTMSDGLVFRVREEDRKQGTLVRATTFGPPELKMLSTSQAEGWTHQETSTEQETDGNGLPKSDKEKTFLWTVEAVNVTVTVPAGTFTNAIQVRRERTDKPDYLRRYWLVPGVGKVREEGERTEELSSYDIKPQ